MQGTLNFVRKTDLSPWCLRRWNLLKIYLMPIKTPEEIRNILHLLE